MSILSMWQKKEEPKKTKASSIPYSEEDIKYLTENYPTVNTKVIAKKLDRSLRSIYVYARSLGLKKVKIAHPGEWSESSIKILRDNYDKLGNKKLAQILKRKETAVTAMAFKLGIKKRSCRTWSEDDLVFLKEEFGRMNIQSIADHLGRSYRSVHTKGYRMGLYKGRS